MQNNVLELLQKLKYDPLDIHYIYSFYGIKITLLGPDGTFAESNQGSTKLNKLAVGSDKFYINQAIAFGRAGLEYTDVRFKTK